MTLVVLAIALCVLMEALFSGAEIGFYSVNRLRLRSRVEARRHGAGVLQKLVDRPDATMMTTLVGTNLMVYAATALATELLSTRPHAEVLATVIMTPVIFVFGEMIPKDLFHRKADSLMYVLAGPADAFRVLLWPVTTAMRALALLLTGGLARGRRTNVLSRAALHEWIAEGRREGVLSDIQHTLSANVMGLLEKQVGDAMIPLADAVTVSADLTGDDLRDAVRDARHSRLPVFSGSWKNVLGILHTLDYIRAMEAGPSAADLARTAVKVRPRDGIHAALVVLQRERQQMAVVTNRKGRPIGIVTVKDLVEEIVGELQDF